MTRFTLRAMPIGVALAMLLHAAAATAADDFQPYAQRIPAVPETSAAAAMSFKPAEVTAKVIAPPAVTALRQQLREDHQKSQLAASASINSATPGAPMTQEQAQALAARMQKMSPAEQMAAAMQLQQQMMGASGGGFSVDEKESEASEKLQEDQAANAADTQKVQSLQIRVDQFFDDWRAAESALEQRNNWEPTRIQIDPKTYFLCEEKQRPIQLGRIRDQQQLADSQLKKAAALEKEARALFGTLNARAQRIATLSAQIKAAPLKQNATSIRGTSQTNNYALLDVLSSLYLRSGERAAVWPQLAAVVQRAPARPGDNTCDFGQ